MNRIVKTFVPMALCALMVPSLAAAGITEKAEVLDATVKIERVNDYALAVQIFPLAKTNARQSYAFHSDTSLPWVPSELGKSQVVVQPDALLIFSEEGESIALTTKADPSGLAKFGKADLISVSGYQLARYFGEVDPAQVILSDDLGLNKRVDGGEWWPCIAGGPGATSCSIHYDANGQVAGTGGGVGYTCTVDCGAGRYACCGVKCECRVNPPSGN